MIRKNLENLKILSAEHNSSVTQEELSLTPEVLEKEIAYMISMDMHIDAADIARVNRRSLIYGLIGIIILIINLIPE